MRFGTRVAARANGTDRRRTPTMNDQVSAAMLAGAPTWELEGTSRIPFAAYTRDDHSDLIFR